MDVTKIQFFFFGCWNDGSCKNNVFLNNIIKSIKSCSDLYDFGVILGDNIYPEVIDKKKHYIETLKSGIECINSINKPLYIVLGNHDVTQCDIITEQARNNKNWNFEKNFYALTFERSNVSVKLIVIDTNLLADDKIYRSIFMDEQQELPCKLPPTINTNYDDMIRFLKRELKTANKYNWVIVAGHEPIASFKEKKNSTKPIANPKINLMVELLGSIPNLIYICADTHNFQYNTISNGSSNITQIVSGTGGATPDQILPIYKDNKFHDIDGIHKIIMHDTYTPYGYSDMIIMKEKIVIMYRQIFPSFQEHLFVIELPPRTDDISADAQQGSGNFFYFKKYLKYKTKYLEKRTRINYYN